MKPSTLARLLAGAANEMFRKKGESVMLSEGDSAPDFQVQTHRNETAKLSAQRGKTIILWFYPKADTPG